MAFRGAARGNQLQNAALNNVQLTIPATAQAGDVAAVIISCSSNPTMPTPPTGWDLDIGPVGDASNTFRAFLLTADVAASGTNSPGSTVTFTISFTSRIVGTILVFSGRTRTGRQFASTVEVAGTTHVIPSLTGVPAGSDLVGATARRRGGAVGTITATGWTEPTDADVWTNFAGGGTTVQAWAQGAYIANSAGGSVGTWNWTGSVSSTGVTFLLSLPPAPAGGLDRLRIGDAIPSAIRIGDSVVSKVYVGDTQVWP